jgi:hypothetical protein
MKTLVIHPIDVTTDFLSEIYSGKDWTVINTNVSKSVLKQQIREHDRIVMLGHGSHQGLYGFNRLVIDSTWVWLLRTKECVCIWCNADEFVTEYNIKGFFTGMIISDCDEAEMFCIHQFKSKDIRDSNILFAKSIGNSIDSPTMWEQVKESYHSTENPIISFNQERIYKSAE